LLDSPRRAGRPSPIDSGGREMNKIEELEERCEQLESRVEALEKALVAALARPSQKTVVVTEIRPSLPSDWRLDGVTWYGGQ